MIPDRKKLATIALNRALRIRRDSGYELWEPICIFDLVEKNGVEVRFLNIPTLEGLYSSDPGPTILLGSDRPSGRKAFTCAHEFGHHVFGHGMRVDNIDDLKNLNSPDEFIADCFAGYLLMPKVAIQYSFTRRGWKVPEATPQQFYTVASYFGVGYTTLIHHMRNSLGLLSYAKLRRLLQIDLTKVRKGFQIPDINSPLIVIDNNWSRIPIDLNVGDSILLPSSTLYEGHCVERVSELPAGCFYKAREPGLGRFFRIDDGWSSFIRVARKNFEGRSRYRHLAE